MAALHRRNATPLTPDVRVTVLSKNEETLDALVGYLRQVGLDVLGSGELEDTRRRVTHAFVVFVDDFDPDALMPLIHEHAAAPRGPTQLLVTNQPSRLLVRLGARVRTNPPVVVPRPVWGFTVLDILRAQLSARA